MKLPFRLLIVFVLAAALFSACSVGGRSALIGKWTPEIAPQGQSITIIEITTGGKFRQENGGVVQEITYQFINDNTISLIAAESQGGSTQLKFVVQGDRLKLTPIDPTSNQPGAETAFMRVK
jgi:hypothetical protein